MISCAPHIALVAPPGLKSLTDLQMHSPNPPIGLAYIAATLKQAGIGYTVIDGTGEALDRVSPYPQRSDLYVQGLSAAEIADRVPAQTTIVGVSCMFSTLWPITRDVIDAIRARFPDVLIVLGGEHGTAVPDHVLNTSAVDVVVLGEGEETFLNVVRTHAAGRDRASVAGIAMRDGDRIVNTGLSARIRAIDDIPIPDWGSFPVEGYVSRHQINGVNLGRSMPLLATRGCPYKCTFCSSPTMWTTRYVPRNPHLVVDEMEQLKKRYNISNFDFQDLTAVVKRSWVVEFASELIKRQLGITWQMPSGTRSEVFDEGVARLLYQSGCRVLAFAPESGDEDVLRAVKKQVDLQELERAAKIAIRNGLNVSLFFVIGFPQDTPQSLKRTLHFLRRMAWAGVHDVSVTKFVPYPGSELFKQLQHDGKIDLDDRFFISPIDFYSKNAASYSERVSTKRLYYSMLWMYANFYLISFATRPLRVLRVLLKAVVTGREETRYAKWFVDRVVTRRRWRRLATAK